MTTKKKSLGAGLAGLPSPTATITRDDSVRVTNQPGRLPAHVLARPAGQQHHMALEGSNTRLHPDQRDLLNALAKRITAENKAQGVDLSVRITSNTLIRVAIDALLANEDKLHGATEEDLLRALIV